MDERIEFKSKTKQIIAQRAGYICSHPQCDVITIGPGDTKEDISNIGEAAHIYSAAQNGPRGQNNLTEDQLKSVSNGIWMCKNHARLVDVNGGGDFTAPQLISWKMLHEDSIKKSQGRIRRTLGWVHKITVIESPVLKPNSVLELGKVTFIESIKNAAGKTALCEWLSVIGSGRSPTRWIPVEDSNLNYEISVFTPEEHKISVSISGDDYSISLDKIDVPFCGLNFQVYDFDFEGTKEILRNGLNNIEAMSKIIDVDEHTLKKLFSELKSSEFSKIKDVKYTKDNRLEIRFKRSMTYVFFGALSSGERDIVILELLIAKMRYLAMYNPLIFFFEASLSSLDHTMIRYYLDYLSSSEMPFQSVVTSVRREASPPNIEMTHYILNGTESDVIVSRA